MKRLLAPFAVGALAAVGACAPAASSSSGAAQSLASGAPTVWLCRPDRPADACRNADLTATSLAADGSRLVLQHRPLANPGVDCFYVYPTVDLELVPGNHEDLTDDRLMRAATLAQAARFGEACALWVPLYRQVTIGTYLQPKDTLERGLARAFADVERAFSEYLAHAEPRRKIVLVGHSQGGEMVVRLLRRFFDDDPALRARLLLAMPIGADVDVPPGATRGGTVKNIPVCTHANEVACIVAYRTHAEGEAVDPGRFAPPPGRETVCVDPAALDRGDTPDTKERLSRAYFALWPEVRRFMHGVADVKTPFVMVPDFYTARCVRGPGGYAWLAAAAAPSTGDARTSPVDLADKRLSAFKLGLHVLDLQLTQGDLVDLVARRGAALQDREASQ